MADEGIGIPKEIQDQIFDEGPISRPGTENELGTGHGLLIVCDFIKAYGADIHVESAENQGTRMVMKFKRWIPEKSGGV